MKWGTAFFVLGLLGGGYALYTRHQVHKTVDAFFAKIGNEPSIEFEVVKLAASTTGLSTQAKSICPDFPARLKSDTPGVQNEKSQKNVICKTAFNQKQIELIAGASMNQMREGIIAIFNVKADPKEFDLDQGIPLETLNLLFKKFDRNQPLFEKEKKLSFNAQYSLVMHATPPEKTYEPTLETIRQLMLWILHRTVAQDSHYVEIHDKDLIFFSRQIKGGDVWTEYPTDNISLGCRGDMNACSDFLRANSIIP